MPVLTPQRWPQEEAIERSEFFPSRRAALRFNWPAQSHPDTFPQCGQGGPGLLCTLPGTCHQQLIPLPSSWTGIAADLNTLGRQAPAHFLITENRWVLKVGPDLSVGRQSTRFWRELRENIPISASICLARAGHGRQAEQGNFYSKQDEQQISFVGDGPFIKEAERCIQI